MSVDGDFALLKSDYLKKDTIIQVFALFLPYSIENNHRESRKLR